MCNRKGCDFSINNGDNIYDNGVDSVTDPQFEAKFEKPYASFTIPFYLVLGNHDNGDGLGSDSKAGDFQVQYSTRTDPPRLSDKWNMPARYFPVHKENGNTTASFFGLDTNTLMFFGDPLSERDLLGAAQQAWLDDEIAASTSTWKFTWAHHPYISNGQHGNAGESDGIPGQGQNVKTFYEAAACGKVDVIIAGHDHDLQWIEPVAACGETEFIISGAGGQVRQLGGGSNPAFFEQGATLGFYWVELVGTKFTGEIYDVDGNLLFARTFAKHL